MGSHKNIISDQETHFMVKEVDMIMRHVGAVPPIARIHMSGKQGMEVVLGPLIIVSSNLCGECVLSVATSLGSGSCGEHFHQEIT